MEVAEAELVSWEAEVEVVPSVRESAIHLIGGDVGPLEPGVVCRVPLYVALFLHSRRKCRLLAPAWLTRPNLEDLLQQEKDSSTFLPLPPGILEVGSALLKHAPEELEEAAELKVLLKDLWEWREAKLRKDMARFAQEPQALVARIDHLTPLEVLRLRSGLGPALAVRSELAATAAAAAAAAADASNTSTTLHSHA